MNRHRIWSYIILILAIIGIFDAGYLSYNHYLQIIPPCSNHGFFTDCARVLQSHYALFFGIPVAYLGFVHYTVLTIWILAATYKIKSAKFLTLIQSTAGFLASGYFVYLQLFVIRAICKYCMLSAIVSTLLFIIIMIHFGNERKILAIAIFGWIYRHITKPVFFMMAPEFVHDRVTRGGELIGNIGLSQRLIKIIFNHETPKLTQKITGIEFVHPVGLAAGFDYEARLTKILSPWGFGFQSVGTITNLPYEGNPRPLLGRLPQSRSLMVNKGFKNDGAKAVIKKLNNRHFGIPVGISIGRTNSHHSMTQSESVSDIIRAFTLFESSNVQHAYYELNISCPNLFGNVSFYPPKNLMQLLTEIDRLRIKRPVFVKMPIEKTDREVREMLDVICDYSPKGVIFGNLQKNRDDPALIPAEVRQFKVGYFSGKPTFKRSNELIRLAYKHYHKQLVIIGCGGIFNGSDAYTKICLGASLLQLITGLIYEGPQLVAKINFELEELLKKDGFKHISQATGSRN